MDSFGFEIVNQEGDKDAQGVEERKDVELKQPVKRMSSDSDD